MNQETLLDKQWLSKTDFETLDQLLKKMGFKKGYYGLLEDLKKIASNMGAFTFEEGGEKSKDKVKTINHVILILSGWSVGVKEFRHRTQGIFEEQIATVLTEIKNERSRQKRQSPGEKTQ